MFLKQRPTNTPQLREGSAVHTDQITGLPPTRSHAFKITQSRKRDTGTGTREQTIWSRMENGDCVRTLGVVISTWNCQKHKSEFWGVGGGGGVVLPKKNEPRTKSLTVKTIPGLQTSTSRKQAMEYAWPPTSKLYILPKAPGRCVHGGQRTRPSLPGAGKESWRTTARSSSCHTLREWIHQTQGTLGPRWITTKILPVSQQSTDKAQSVSKPQNSRHGPLLLNGRGGCCFTNHSIGPVLAQPPTDTIHWDAHKMVPTYWQHAFSWTFPQITQPKPNFDNRFFLAISHLDAPRLPVVCGSNLLHHRCQVSSWWPLISSHWQTLS